MDLPTLSTNTSDSHMTDSTSRDKAPMSVSDASISDNLGTDQPHIEPETSAQTIDPNAIILAEALTDKAISWQIHNCKIIKKTVTQDLPLPFLYHYDSLSDTLKESYPLTPKLLSAFNTPMTPNAAAQLIGIESKLISSPWHVKVNGSLVVFSEALQLAVRLHWTNTGKETQQIYTIEAADALISALAEWQVFGRVDVLYKNHKQPLISVDGQEATTQSLPASSIVTINAQSDYQQLSASQALAIIAKLEADKEALPWFDKAILERLG